MKKHQKVRREDAALVIQNRNSFRRNSPRWRKALAWAVTAWTLGMAPVVYASDAALPVLDAKDAAVSIVTNGDVMHINSGAQNNLIKWVDFSIASGKTVDFHDKNYLNYVTGSAVSDIYGTLAGTGSIYLVNPNGILIGDGAVVNAGNLHLSTRTLTDTQLNNFSVSGTNPLTSGAIGGDVINMGRLNANSITVEGGNITFKNVADVTQGATLTNGVLTGGTQNTDVSLTATKTDPETGNDIGEIHLGFAVGDEATAVNDTQYKNVAAPDLSGWNFNDGAKTPVQYMLVRNAYELQNIQNNKSSASGFYMLASDVDMSTLNNFTPINNFFGKFDGLNHQIQNLTVNMGNADDAGLFGIIKSSGVVENVGLVGGSVTGRQNIGGIAGYNDGTIRNVYHTGSVTGLQYVGGIVGYNRGGTVERAYNTGAVTGTRSDVGGIVGYNMSWAQSGVNYKGTIREVFNTGTISSSGSTVGGVVGSMFGSAPTVTNAYNTGNVTGTFIVGGIVGEMDNLTAKVTNVYNTGRVTGTGSSGYVGGLVGDLNQGTLTNAYTQSGVASATNITDYENYYVHDTVGNRPNEGATIADEADWKKAATFADFGFTQNADNSYTGFSADGVWRIYEGKTMPLLTAFLTRTDNRVEKEYDGTADAGTFGGYSALTFDGAVDQIKKVDDQYVYGCNYIKDYAVVTPKDLTVSFGSRIYDGTPNVTGAGTLAGVVGNDVVTLSAATGATAAFGDKNVGTDKAVTLTGYSLTGEKAGNYTLSGGTGTITTADLKISVEDYSREYDGTTDASGATLTVVDGEIFTGDSISGGTKTFDTKEVGTGKTVTVSNVTISDGNSGNNYNVTYQPNTNSEITGSTNPNPNPDPNPNPNPNPTPKDVIEESTNNQNAAKEYTDVVASLESGTNTVLPTTNNMLPTDGVMPTNSVLPTGNNAPTGSPQPTEASQENNSASGEQNETQEQNGLLPTQQTDNGQISAGKQETQLGITYTDINMPESMSVEALATSLNGGSTTTTPNNAGGEATQNGPATEPTATTGGNMSGASEEDEA